MSLDSLCDIVTSCCGHSSQLIRYQMALPRSIEVVRGIDTDRHDARFERWPVTSPCFEPDMMNGLRTQQILEHDIVFTDLHKLDYFKVHQGRACQSLGSGRRTAG